MWRLATIAAIPVNQTITLTLNRKPLSIDVEPGELLVDVLRNQLQLTGTHVGCDTAQCGACVVHVNGESIKACCAFAVQFDGAEITTIEGIGTPDNLHPMQIAFQQHHGLQCGFCTPGMVMSALDLIAKHPNPTDSEIREWLDGNLCRCTGYHNIVKAVVSAANASG